MCLKYVNATVGVYSSVEMDQNGNAVSFQGAFDRLMARKDANGTLIVGGFKIVTSFNLLGTDKEERVTDCPVQQRKGRLEVQIKLARVTTNENKKMAMLLDNFELDLEQLTEENQMKEACFYFLNQRRVTRVGSFELEPGPGPYVIKVEARWKRDDGGENPYAVQSLYYLNIVEPF